MKDIAPELLNLIEDGFKEAYDKSDTIRKTLFYVKKGKATYKEVNEYAEEVGDLLAKTFQEYLSSDVLPDGRMYYNIAERVVGTPLKNNHKLVSKICAEVQTDLNKEVGLGLRGIPPKINRDRIRGLVDKVSDAEKFDEVKNILDEPVVNFTMSTVDDAIRENAEFQFMSGLAPKIKRISTGHCCEWCEKLAGTYNYEDVRDTGNNVFRRHRHCRCTVEFITNGKRQNVHTKKWKK